MHNWKYSLLKVIQMVRVNIHWSLFKWISQHFVGVLKLRVLHWYINKHTSLVSQDSYNKQSAQKRVQAKVDCVQSGDGREQSAQWAFLHLISQDHRYHGWHEETLIYCLWNIAKFRLWSIRNERFCSRALNHFPQSGTTVVHFVVSFIL